ncbi:hypothetical protein IWQ60_006789 [Tieghemiomyces parasiticus]|uniref:Uncharacterized protein n=1 Tax=Tieghemiomyces parasiticus TaxID=78921 RepID=A0A9W8A247_9FUNG|nr:hypothetical protein IWQ60_006789 [Tieghemiomyces parasiticus]
MSSEATSGPGQNRSLPATGGRHGLGIGRRKAPVAPNPNQVTPLTMMTKQLVQTPKASSGGAYRCLSPTVVPFPSLSTADEAKLMDALTQPAAETSPIPSPTSEPAPPPSTPVVVPTASLAPRRCRAMSLPVPPPPPVDLVPATSENASPPTLGPPVSAPTRTLRRRSVLQGPLPNISTILGPKTVGQTAKVPSIKPDPAPPRCPLTATTPTVSHSPPPPTEPLNLNPPALMRSFSAAPAPDTPTRSPLFKRPSTLSRFKRRSSVGTPLREPTVAPLDYAPHQYYSFADFVARDTRPAAQRETLRRLDQKITPQPPPRPRSGTIDSRKASLATRSRSSSRASPFASSSPFGSLGRRSWSAAHDPLGAIEEHTPGGPSTSPLRTREYASGDSPARSAPTEPPKLPLAELPAAGTTRARRGARKPIPFANALGAYRRGSARTKGSLLMTLHALRLAVHDCLPGLALKIIERDLPDTRAARTEHPTLLKLIFLRALANRLESVALALYRRGYPQDVNDTVAVPTRLPFPRPAGRAPGDGNGFRALMDRARRSSSFSTSPSASRGPGRRHRLLPTIFLLAVAFKMGALVQVMIPQASIDRTWLGLTPLLLACASRKLPSSPGTFAGVAPSLPSTGSSSPSLPSDQRPLLILSELLERHPDATVSLSTSHYRHLCRVARASGCPPRLTEAVDPPVGALLNPATESTDDTASVTSHATVGGCPVRGLCRATSATSLASDVSVSTSHTTISDDPAPLTHPIPPADSPVDTASLGTRSRSTFRASGSTCSSSSSSATVCMESFHRQRILSRSSVTDITLAGTLPAAQAKASRLARGATTHRLFNARALSPTDGPTPAGPLRITALDVAVVPLLHGASANPTSDAEFVHTLLEGTGPALVRASRQCLVLQQDLDLTLALVHHDAPLTLQNDRFGNLPLHLAARAGLLDLVLVYLWLGLSPNAPGQNGWTPLHEAMSWGHHSVALQLLAHGARLDQANRDGLTPVQLALLFGHSLADVESMVDIGNISKATVTAAHHVLEYAAGVLGLPSPLLRPLPPKLPVLVERQPDHVGSPSASSKQRAAQLGLAVARHPARVASVPMTNRWSISEFGSPHSPLADWYALASRGNLSGVARSPLFSLEEFLETEAGSAGSVTPKTGGSNPAEQPLAPTPSSPSRHSADASWGHPSSSLTTALPFSTARMEPMTKQLAVLARRASTHPPATMPTVPVSATDAESTLKKFKRWSSSELKRSVLSLL